MDLEPDGSTSRDDMAQTLGIAKDKVRLISPYIGRGGFGGQVVGALTRCSRARRPRRQNEPCPHFYLQNTTHRPATIQRIRVGAAQDGKITAIGHESSSGDLPGRGRKRPSVKRVFSMPAPTA